MINSPQLTKDLKQIGHYDILRCIGRGGMGLVYLARDTRLNREVAIKCLRSELFEPHYRERFKREALLLAKLNHPYIVQIYDFIETPDQLALVMEFVDGQNLQLHLREHIVPFCQRMQWLTQIAQGLAVAHDTGIIHRDLKAENILINKRGEAKISDLGIAKSQDFNATLTDHVTGSYCSMSPEQAMGEELDSRSDLFSFGIMAYQLLCNAHPFGETDNKLQLMQRIISHAPIPPTKHNPGLPQEISELMGQLLSKNPDNRPANTHWLAAQCEKLSELFLETSFEPDITQALQQSQQTPRQKIIASDSGIHTTRKNTKQEHATFDSIRKKETPLTKQNFYAYIKTNSVTVILGSLTLLMLVGVGIWQLQPKEPRYVAVLPPTLSTTDMQESQQELVKGAVYDAIQQSVLQLDGYYLIPQNEIADINANSSKEGLEIVRRATAADELITTNIQCKIEACTINLTRLTPDNKKQEGRLRVKDTKTVDVLTDNYLSVATIVQNNMGALYSEKMASAFNEIDSTEYLSFLEANRSYREKGASHELLNVLDGLQRQTKKMLAVQTLYTEISLDLHYETKNLVFLNNLEIFITSNSGSKKSRDSIFNQYYLQIAQNNFEGATKSLEDIKQLNASFSSINELHAYMQMAKKDYSSAIEFYKKSNSMRTSANILYYIAMAYWYSADTVTAKLYVEQALKLSPNFYKAISLYGSIELLEGNIDRAITSFKHAALKKPNDMYNLSHLGLCYLLLKNYTEANSLFNRALNLAPQNTFLKLNKADSYDLMGDKTESRKIYESIVNSTKLTGVTNEELTSVTQAYAHLGRFSEALTVLQQLEKLDSQNIETTYTAALVHTLASNNSSAILNISNTLKNGMNKIWFSFPWFNSLCKDDKFIDLMRQYGEPSRCALHNNQQ